MVQAFILLIETGSPDDDLSDLNNNIVIVSIIISVIISVTEYGSQLLEGLLSSR